MAKQKLGPNQRKWLKALESGDYSQAKMALHRLDGFCCLGVACEVFKKDTTRVVTLEEHDITKYDGSEDVAPEYVVDALALSDEIGSPRMRGGKELTALNDEGQSFLEIAALIRKDPSQYFREPR